MRNALLVNTRWFICLIVLIRMSACDENEVHQQEPVDYVFYPVITLKHLHSELRDATVSVVIDEVGTETFKEFGLVLSLQTNPTIDDHKYPGQDPDQPKTYNQKISGLKIDSDYFLKAYVQLEDDSVIYSEQITIRTGVHKVTSFSPATASSGDVVTINGLNFQKDSTTVYFNDLKVECQVKSPSVLTFTVPQLPKSDSVTLGVEVGGLRIGPNKKLFYKKGAWIQLNELPDKSAFYPVVFTSGDAAYLNYSNSPHAKEIYRYDKNSDSWDLLTTFPGENGYNGMFVYYDKLFVLETTSQKMWQYDLKTSVWHQVGLHPIKNWQFASVYGFSFVHQDHAYIGLGWVITPGQPTIGNRTIWRYSFVTSTWQRQSDFPGVANSAVRIFGDNQSVYMVGGYTTQFSSEKVTYSKELWLYNPSSDLWTRKKDYPGKASVSLNGFLLNGKLYVGGGGDVAVQHNSLLYQSEFFQYDLATDTWKQVSDLPFKREFAYSFVLDNDAHIGGGMENLKENFDLWRFEVD